MGQQSFKTKILLEVWKDKSLSTHQKCIMNYLIFRMNNESHDCWPSQYTIALETGMDIKTVNKHIKALVKAGYILQIKNKDIKNGQRWALSRYIIKFPHAEKGIGTNTITFNEGSDLKNQGMGTQETKVLEQIPINYKENNKKNYTNSFNNDPIKLQRLYDSKEALNRKIKQDKEIKALAESKKNNMQQIVDS